MIEKGRALELLSLAKDLARQRTDKGLDQAADIFLLLLNEGYQNSDILINFASCILQGSNSGKRGYQEKALAFVDKAVCLDSENINTLENAIQCYELVLDNFPEKLNDIIRISLKVLDIDSDHVEAMITLACYRDHPLVSLDLEDAIRMLEWAKDIEPNNLMVNLTLAKLYSESGQIGKSRSLFRQVIKHSESGSCGLLDSFHEKKRSHPETGRRKPPKFGVN